MKNKNTFILFSIGALGYGLLEIIWRGYTHWSMLTAGGICFVFLGKIEKALKKTSIFLKAIIGSCFITSIELIFGIIFNIILHKNIWNYSKLPLNIGGQICILYSILWGFLSLIFIPLAGLINKKLNKGVLK